jgi:hypothetical protein
MALGSSTISVGRGHFLGLSLSGQNEALLSPIGIFTAELNNGRGIPVSSLVLRRVSTP